MWHRFAWIGLALFITWPAGAESPTTTVAAKFPRELVEWKQLSCDPVFLGAGAGHWDAAIRERGWILREGDRYRLWYSGYDGMREGLRQLGYATSRDGLHWLRSRRNPLCPGHWVEDVMVVRSGGTYYMFAEGPRPSEAQLLTSADGEIWRAVGRLDIRTTAGQRIVPPFGTPTVWLENGSWNLFYERGDLGVWLATTRNPRSLRWENVQDEPVLETGPDEYDSELIAIDQIVKRDGIYYAFYHGSGPCAEGTTRTWNTNLARSADLIHWEKYPDNPIVSDNKSSGIVVPTSDGNRLYTMHDQMDVFESPID